MEHKGLSYRARENRAQAVGGEAVDACSKPRCGGASWMTPILGLAISLAAVGNPVDGDGVGGLLEKDAVVADAEAEEALELAGQGPDAARAGLGIAVNGFEDGHRDVLRDGADLGRDLRLEVNLLHGFLREASGKSGHPPASRVSRQVAYRAIRVPGIF